MRYKYKVRGKPKLILPKRELETPGGSLKRQIFYPGSSLEDPGFIRYPGSWLEELKDNIQQEDDIGNDFEEPDERDYY